MESSSNITYFNSLIQLFKRTFMSEPKAQTIFDFFTENFHLCEIIYSYYENKGALSYGYLLSGKFVCYLKNVTDSFHRNLLLRFHSHSTKAYHRRINDNALVTRNFRQLRKPVRLFP